MRFVTLDAIRVPVVLLRLVAIDTVARGLRFRMALMACEAIRVTRVCPRRQCLIFLLVASRAVNTRHSKDMWLMTT